MGNIVETLKWLFIGVVIALLIGVVVFFTLPKVENYETKATPTDETTYSTTIYGIPELDVNHYRLDEDQYFDKLVNGVLYVGRFDPANYPVWYEDKLVEHIREGLLEMIEGLLVYDEDGNLDIVETYLALELELSELTPEQSDVLLFISWYESRFGEFELDRFMTLEEAEQAIKEAKEEAEKEEAEAAAEGEEGSEEGSEEGTEEESDEDEVELDDSGEVVEGNENQNTNNNSNNQDPNNVDTNDDGIEEANNVNTTDNNENAGDGVNDSNVDSDNVNQP